jgi:hypothetical protein
MQKMYNIKFLKLQQFFSVSLFYFCVILNVNTFKYYYFVRLVACSENLFAREIMRIYFDISLGNYFISWNFIFYYQKVNCLFYLIFLDSLVQWSIKHCILAQSLQVWNTVYVLHGYVCSNSLLIEVAFTITHRKLIDCCTVHKRNACTLRQNDKLKFKGKCTTYAAEIAKLSA